MLIIIRNGSDFMQKKIISCFILLISTCILLSSCNSGPITEEKAKTIAHRLIAKKEIVNILNYDDPVVEKIEQKEPHSVYNADNKGEIIEVPIKGKTVYKVTFHTIQDDYLGPIVIYIDYNNGKLYGLDSRKK